MRKELFLVFHGRFPSEKAASLFVAKSAEAFSKKDYDVTVLVPKRKETTEDPYQAYDVDPTFKIMWLPTLDFFNTPIPSVISFWVSYSVFSFSVLRYLKKKASTGAIVYSNELLPLWIASFRFKNTFYEIHDFPESKLGIFMSMIRRFRGLVVHNIWKQNRILESFPKYDAAILLERNAVDVQKFHTGLSKKFARQILDLPEDAILVVYTGHLYAWKGVHVLAHAAQSLRKPFLICFVGGTSTDTASFTSLYGDQEQIRILGHQPHSQMPVWQAAADILVLPNTATEPISALYTSPMKLFEYMASKRPIIASDLPSVRELATDGEVTYVAPDDPSALVKAMEYIATRPREIEVKVEHAFARVQDHTWDKRAGRIRAFMEERIESKD